MRLGNSSPIAPKMLPIFYGEKLCRGTAVIRRPCDSLVKCPRLGDDQQQLSSECGIIQKLGFSFWKGRGPPLSDTSVEFILVESVLSGSHWGNTSWGVRICAQLSWTSSPTVVYGCSTQNVVPRSPAVLRTVSRGCAVILGDQRWQWKILLKWMFNRKILCKWRSNRKKH